MSDSINHPSHYCQGDIECIDAMRACSSREEFLGYLRLSHFKYSWRLNHKHENPIEDAEKAKWFWDTYLEELKNGCSE